MSSHACRADRLTLALPLKGAAWPTGLLVKTLLQLFALLFALTAMPAYGADGDSIEQAEQQAIEKTISGQIDAFARDDAKAAFSFAAPSIQRQFGDPNRFMMMVLRGYPMVYRPSSIEFLDANPNGKGSIMQQVRVSDGSGKVWIAFYNMRKIAEGEWRIAGVRMREVDTKVI